MTDKNPKDAADENSALVNLNELAGFDFGVAWSSAKTSKDSERRPQGRSDRGGHSGQRPDRRMPRRERDNGPRENNRFRGERSEPRSDRPANDRHEGRRGDRRERHGDFRRRDFFRPTVNVAFYPEEEPLKVLAQVIRQNYRTYQLFDIAKTILQKPERFYVLVSALPQKGEANAGKLFCSVPDQFPFEKEDDAINHVMGKFIDYFFELNTVEVEAPKGNFLGVARCTITGDLIAPPNHHSYNTALHEYHATRFPKMEFAAFQSKVEVVKDPDLINQWMESMTKQTRYVLRAAFVKDGTEAPIFENLDLARRYLLTHLRDKVVVAKDFIRVPGKSLESLPKTDLLRSIEMQLGKQLAFPLDTANNLRGRLRRENLHTYKSGKKGIAYVCAVRRKPRDPEAKFADTIQSLIEFIEKNPKVLAKDLPSKFLGLTEPAEGENWNSEDETKIIALRKDLRWLIVEGYVTEFDSGELLAQPIVQKTETVSKEKTDTVDVADSQEETDMADEVAKGSSCEVPEKDTVESEEVPETQKETVASEPSDARTDVEEEKKDLGE